MGLAVVTYEISLVRLEASEPSCDDKSCCVTWYQLVHSFILVTGNFFVWLPVYVPTPPGLDSLLAIPYYLLMLWFACDAMLPLWYYIDLPRVDTCHVVGFYFQCISCCMIVELFVVSGDSCWVHTNVLTGLVFVARYGRGIIFYLSKDMEQERARISSPARCLWSGAAPSHWLRRLPLPVKLCTEPCLAWYSCHALMAL